MYFRLAIFKCFENDLNTQAAGQRENPVVDLWILILCHSKSG